MFVVEGALSDEQGCIRSGKRNPLSLANCSKHIGRNSVKETTTKTSLEMIRFRLSLQFSGSLGKEYEPSKGIAQPTIKLAFVVLFCAQRHMSFEMVIKQENMSLKWKFSVCYIIDDRLLTIPALYIYYPQNALNIFDKGLCRQ